MVSTWPMFGVPMLCMCSWNLANSRITPLAMTGDSGREHGATVERRKPPVIGRPSFPPHLRCPSLSPHRRTTYLIQEVSTILIVSSEGEAVAVAGRKITSRTLPVE